MERYYLAPRLF